MSIKAKLLFLILSVASIMIFCDIAKSEGNPPPATKDNLILVKECPNVQVKWKTVVRKVEVEKPVLVNHTRVVEVNEKTLHATVLVGSTRTNLETSQDPGVTKVKAKRELDLGFQLMKEFEDGFDASFVMTVQGSTYVGIGIGF